MYTFHFHCFVVLLFQEFIAIVVDEEYVRRQLREAQEESGDSMKSLRWDGATLRKVRQPILQ